VVSVGYSQYTVLCAYAECFDALYALPCLLVLYLGHKHILYSTATSRVGKKPLSTAVAHTEGCLLRLVAEAAVGKDEDHSCNYGCYNCDGAAAQGTRLCHLWAGGCPPLCFALNPSTEPSLMTFSIAMLGSCTGAVLHLWQFVRASSLRRSLCIELLATLALASCMLACAGRRPGQGYREAQRACCSAGSTCDGRARLRSEGERCCCQLRCCPPGR
jgi:hypothetical protein